jgi:hypothetical protein
MTNEITTKPTLSPAVVEMLATGNLPTTAWETHDDLCDCTYQRIGMWTNPYLAETLEVRMCCIWADLYKQYPDYVRTVPGYWDDNAKEWVTEPMEWNGEDDMPDAIWVRHLARKYDITVQEARALNLPAPKGQPIERKQKPTILLSFCGEWIPVELGFA